ncbi:MAG: two-component regulator propeller domain-containing protein, partial [Salinibacter sp.]
MTSGPGEDLWIATRDGTSRYDGSTVTPVDELDEQLNQELTTIYYDRSDTLWIASRTELFAYDGSTVSYSQVEGKPARLTADIAEISSDDRWFATLRDGLLHYDGSSFERFTTADGLPSNAVRALSVDDQGRLWIGLQRTIARFEDGEFKTVPRKGRARRRRGRKRARGPGGPA